MPLTLQEAQTVITGAHERAAKIAALVTVAVVDEGGHLQALGRMNGAAPLSARIAETKAARLSTAKYTGVKALRRPAACISKADYLRTAKASLNSRGRYRMTISRRHDSSHECDRHRLQSRSASPLPYPRA